MIGDPFKLVPTSTETAPFNLAPPTGDITSLIPQLPPSDYNQGKPTPNISLQDLLGVASRQTIAPSYQYTFEQEKRFSNPYLQFNPKPLGGYDTEDIYGKFQGAGEQLWNALVKTGATAGSSFVSNFSSLGSSIDAIRRGTPFDEDSNLGQTQGWLKELENNYPNYYTQWEREHPYQSGFNLLHPVGLANFWGDKVLKNVGFTVGSLASSLLVDAGINLATEGTAAPGTFIMLSNQIRKAITPLKNAFRSLSKASVLNKVDDLAGISRVGVGVNQGLKELNQAYNLKKGLQFAGTTYFAAQGEAMVEGYQTYWQTKEDLYKQELDKGSLDLNKIADIEKTAQEAANTTTVLNIPVIAASNLLQFPVIFGGKSLLKMFESPFLDVMTKEGLTVVNNYSKKQAWINTLKELGKDFAFEGGEEGYQYYIGNSIHDYYVDKFNNTASNSLTQYLKNQIPKSVQEEGFWESFIIGGLAGGLMGAHHPIKTNLIGANARTEKAKEILQPVYDRFNSTIKDYVHFAENAEHQADQDQVNAFQSAHKALYSTVHDSLKYGIFENFQDSINDLRDLPVEEYNKLFNTEFNEQEKLSHLNSIQKESLRIKDDLTQVNKFFQTNPFDSNYVTQRLRDIYKVDQTQIGNIKAQLFNEFKELTAYNISRLRNTRGRISEIEEELKTIGLEDSIIPVLYNLDSLKGVRQYKKLKEVQLEALKQQVEYYKELEQPQPELNLKVKSLEKLLNKLDYKEELNDSQKEAFRKLIFNEELGFRQLVSEKEFQDKQKELKRQQDIAVNTAEDLEGQTTKPEEKVKEQVETLDKIVPKEEKKVAPPKTSPDIFNKNFSNLNEGDQFRVSLSTEEGVFTLLTKAPFVAEKDGVKYQFTPQGVIKYQEGEQQLRYALDNIGVEKVDSEVHTTTIINKPASKLDINEINKITKLSFSERIPALMKLGIITDVYQYGKRPIVVVNINGIKLPFYRSSSGTSGKTKGKWFPMFGFGKHNVTDTESLWLIKPTIKALENNLGSQAIKDYSDIINAALSWEHSLDLNVQNPFFRPYITFKGDEEEFNSLVFGSGELNVINNGDGSAMAHILSIVSSINNRYQEVEKVEEVKQEPIPEEPAELTPPVKKVVSEQQKIKQAADKIRKNATKPVKDGIYLLEGDNKFAWRYIDENYAVPLTLYLEGNNLKYKGDLEIAIEKKIDSGYLLDDQYVQETNKKEHLQKLLIQKAELKNKNTFENNVGQIVKYKGQVGVLNKENEHYIIETESTIYEIDAKDVDDINSFNISEVKYSQEKYNITNLSEDKVTVNGTSYKINLDSKGNIESLSPDNRPQQKITNEQFIVAVEIERNKLERELLQEVTEQEYTQIKESVPDTLVLEKILNQYLEPSVEIGLNKLYSEQPLSEQEKLAVDLWLTYTFVELEKLIRKFPNVEIFQNTYSNLEIIGMLLYQDSKLSKVIKQNEQEPVTSSTISTTESTRKREKTVIKQDKTEPLSIKSRTESSKKELLNQLDSQIKKLQEEIDKDKNIILGTDISSLVNDESFTPEKLGTDISELTGVSKKTQLNNQKNLNKFLKEEVSDTLKQVLQWRLGKGITIDC